MIDWVGRLTVAGRHLDMDGSGPSSRASRANSGLGGTSTSRLVPRGYGESRPLYPSLGMRDARWHEKIGISENDSSTPPPGREMIGTSYESQTSSAPRTGGLGLSTAMERVIRLERKRAGKVRVVWRLVFLSVCVCVCV